MIAMICPFSNNEKQALLECENINKLANTINPIIRSAKFKNEQEKQLILDYVHKIFFNQWKVK